MPFTAAYPNPRTGDVNRDVDSLRDNLIAFLDEINHALENINSRTIKGDLPQAKIEANQITTNKARINDAQIKSLTADKLTAGEIDAKIIRVKNMNADEINTGTLKVGDNVTIVSDNGFLQIDGSTIIIYDNKNNQRLYMGWDDNTKKFVFALIGADGTGVILDDKGEIVNTGSIDTKKDVYVGGNITMRPQGTTGSGTIQLGSWSSISVGGVDDLAEMLIKALTLKLQAFNITVNATADVVVRGNKVKIGSNSNGNLNILMNGEAVATEIDVKGLQDKITALTQRVAALEARVSS